LPDATPRALTLALKELDAAGLVRRTVLDDYPPSVVYELTASARPIAAAARDF
jgi:DNA-binding HxlR family transcriptional regulator